MDPLLLRHEPSQANCSGEYCVYVGANKVSSAPDKLQELDNTTADSKTYLERCVKSLLQQNETKDIAHQLISSSLSWFWLEAQSKSVDNVAGPAHNATATLTDNENLLELATFEGYLLDEQTSVNRASQSARLDLDKLANQLQAYESNMRLEALNSEWQFYLRILYSITAIVSILLNLITVIVLYRAKPSELRKYLINLAIGDLFMSCFSIPFTYTEYMLGYWDYPPFLCPVVKFVVTLAVYVSVCTMVVIGVNRHVAILYPMKKCSERVWKISKNSVICAIWLSGVIISLPEFIMFKATQFCYNKKFYLDCRNILEDRGPFSYYYTVFLYLTTFVIPLILLCYLYSRIGIRLNLREMPGNADASRDLTMQTKRTKVVKMLIVVVVMFAIFWLPLQTFSLIAFIWPAVRQANYDSTSYNIFVGTYFTCHWLSMAHSCLNPLIYCFMNPKFRKDLRDLICGLRGARTMSHRNYFGSYSTTTLRLNHCSQHINSRNAKAVKQREQFVNSVSMRLASIKWPDADEPPARCSVSPIENRAQTNTRVGAPLGHNNLSGLPTSSSPSPSPSSSSSSSSATSLASDETLNNRVMADNTASGRVLVPLTPALGALSSDGTGATATKLPLNNSSPIKQTDAVDSERKSPLGRRRRMRMNQEGIETVPEVYEDEEGDGVCDETESGRTTTGRDHNRLAVNNNNDAKDWLAPHQPTNTSHSSPRHGQWGTGIIATLEQANNRDLRSPKQANKIVLVYRNKLSRLVHLTRPKSNAKRDSTTVASQTSALSSKRPNSNGTNIVQV